jgi:signal transduction histidine kinase/CheY-like chemotaxis protein
MQATLIGVLYLENPLAARAFTPARIAVLDLLASQAAIAIENARLYADLQKAHRLEAMGTLAGGIAHDLNNILGAILGYGEMALRDAAAGTRLRRDLEAIMVAGERGRALVERVLAFSRSSVAERLVVHIERVMREALDLLRAKIPQGIVLEARLDAGPAAILGDPTQAHQILMNLATNAIQAMPAGGTLTVALDVFHSESARPATVGNLGVGEYIRLTVADCGGGISHEIIDRIFDPFFTTKETGVGTGLGLSLVHGIVMDLGGAVDVRSRPGAGSTFTVHLPRSGDALDAVGNRVPNLPSGKGECVLVVDDEEPLVTLAARTLDEVGYVPIGFTSGVAALAAFRDDPARFDAMIADERMPDMSGCALVREVRGLRGNIPILVMSGYVGGGLMERAREAGAADVLKKPLSAHDLATGLARVLQK